MAIALSELATVFILYASPAGNGELCQQSLRVTPAFSCVETPHGIALAPQEEEARRLARLAEEGERRFRSLFGTQVARYAVTVGPNSAELVRSLRSAGFLVQLPWRSREEYNRMREGMVRRQAVERASGPTPPNMPADEYIEEAIRQFRQRLLTETDPDLDSIPHELGHKWFEHAFWRGDRPDSGDAYGTPAPDWLDEGAALLMESEEAARRRREEFRHALSSGRVGSLIEFLNAEHPMAEYSRAMARAVNPTGRPGHFVVTRTEGLPALPNPRMVDLYYAHARVFADFLIEMNGDPRVLARLAAAFSAGRSLGEWLAAEGAALGTGTTVAELDMKWRDWLSANYRTQAREAPSAGPPHPNSPSRLPVAGHGETEDPRPSLITVNQDPEP